MKRTFLALVAVLALTVAGVLAQSDTGIAQWKVMSRVTA
jgi:hypothetical protein